MDITRSCLAVLLVTTSVCLVSCSLSGKKQKNKDPYGLGAYQRAGGRVAGMGTGAAGVSGGSTSGEATQIGNSGVSAAGITPDEDIVWAPENPNEAIGGGLEELWKKPENKAWHVSYREASQQAREMGRPLLVWFTDSMYSPLCRRLSDELFSKSEFEGWATMRVVRLRVDSSIPAKEKNTDLGVRKARYIEKLRKRFGVHGNPTVLILMPGGEVQARYRGYKKGDSDYYWARMKQAVVKAEESYGKWREKYEKRGYRIWTSRDGRRTFAKLYRFKPGSVTLIDPDGKRGTTSFRKLCDADQAWILLQKKKYEASRKR
ncbi:MAG: thioredoxin family protein [Verrucomicrobiae bacterium]|nr:thioredoxin family protein [Verrucomicrobiae bacterium]NNJ86260.1 thioredoxin family protein [Akkermansiaceae bacterium]